ncbi:MAG: hypothetical protein HC875_22450 [Anaerolineales bacterium]|nr:hypothetical protein [Anaerolineales bacterium]
MSEMLKTKFEVVEIKPPKLAVENKKQASSLKYKIKRVLKSFAAGAGLLQCPGSSQMPYPYHEYTCRPLLEKTPCIKSGD